MLRGAERVWSPSGSERSEDRRARRSQTARAWPRAAQLKVDELRFYWHKKNFPLFNMSISCQGKYFNFFSSAKIEGKVGFFHYFRGFICI